MYVSLSGFGSSLEGRRVFKPSTAVNQDGLIYGVTYMLSFVVVVMVDPPPQPILGQTPPPTLT